MANKRVSELNELAAASLKNNDLFLVVDTASSSLESKKIKALSLKNYMLLGGLTASISHAQFSDTASYINPTNIGLIPSSSYAVSSSWSNRSYWSNFSDTASYINAVNISGSVPSSSYSNTASYVLYQYGNGKIETSQTASYVQVSNSSSFLIYVPGTYNGTASYAIHSQDADFNGTASYLLYTGVPNGTSSFTMNIKNPEITSSYLILQPGRINGSASYAISSSWSDTANQSYRSTTSSFLNYTGVPNGTSSYAMKTEWSEFSNFANVSFYTNGTASYSDSGSVCISASYALTASYATTSSFCTGTSSYALTSSNITDTNIYRMWGPFSSLDSGGSTNSTEAFIQNFIINTPTVAGTTIIIMALCDIKVPITTTDTDLYTVSLYLDYTEPLNTHSYGPIDTTRPNNYINLSPTGAFTLTGYDRQSTTLVGTSVNVSGSWYRLTTRATNGATLDTTRGVKFFIYTKPNVVVTQTSYPPF